MLPINSLYVHSNYSRGPFAYLYHTKSNEFLCVFNVFNCVSFRFTSWINFCSLKIILILDKIQFMWFICIYSYRTLISTHNNILWHSAHDEQFNIFVSGDMVLRTWFLYYLLLKKKKDTVILLFR